MDPIGQYNNAQSLRDFIQTEFRSQIREKSSVVIDCLLCAKAPSNRCPVCYPSKSPTKSTNCYRKLTKYSESSTIFGDKYANLCGEKLTVEQINEKKRRQQVEKLQQVILDLRKTVQDTEKDKLDTLDALKHMTDVCNHMRERQQFLDNEILRKDNEVKARDKRIQELEKALENNNKAVSELRVQCASSEACRSNSAKEITRLKQLLQKRSDFTSNIEKYNTKYAQKSPHSGYSQLEVPSSPVIITADAASNFE